jgi:hypothetical protein
VGAPFVSVVIAYEDRRATLEHLESWTKEQSTDPDAFEVVAVVGPSSGLRATDIGDRLRVQDQLIQDPGQLRSHLQHAGLGAARGEVILLTEDHCLAEAGCVGAVVEAFERDPALQAATLRYGHESRTDVARLEADVFEANVAADDERWDRVRARGFAIRRGVAMAAGGIEADLGVFAEAVLASRLHRSGIAIGHIEAAGIRHVNTLDMADLVSSVDDYIDGQLRHCVRTDPAVDDVYFPRAVVYARAEMMPWHRSLRTAADLVAIAFAAPEARRVATGAALRTASGPRGARVSSDVGRRSAARAVRRADPDSTERIDGFQRLWEACALRRRVSTLQAVAAPPPAALAPGRYEGEHLARLDAFGLHAPEAHEGRSFRWAAPVLSLDIASPRARNLTVELDTGPLRPDLAGVALGAASRGRALRPVIDGNRIRVSVPGGGRLTILADRLDVRNSRERRRLALPVFGLAIEG